MAVESPEYAFRVVSVIATGAYATVVLAEPVDEDRRVVIKVLQPELAGREDILARTRDEARLLSKLRHPNIVAVERLTEYRGRPVLVMEHVDGVDLATLVRAAPLPSPEALEIVRQVAGALDAAWQALHVVHRDIKPSNVLLSVAGAVKLVDFGLARADFEEREADTDVMVLGSLGYMAPERFDDQHAATPAVDVYALGITLVFLLTGRIPVLPRSRQRHDAELERQLGHVAPPDLGEDERAALRALVADTCAHDPTRRPSAAEVARQAGLLIRASDLAALAAERVVPLASRIRDLPQHHPEWTRIAFLDEGSREGEVDPVPSKDETPRSAMARLLRFLRRGG